MELEKFFNVQPIDGCASVKTVARAEWSEISEPGRMKAAIAADEPEYLGQPASHPS